MDYNIYNLYDISTFVTFVQQLIPQNRAIALEGIYKLTTQAEKGCRISILYYR